MKKLETPTSTFLVATRKKFWSINVCNFNPNRDKERDLSATYITAGPKQQPSWTISPIVANVKTGPQYVICDRIYMLYWNACLEARQYILPFVVRPFTFDFWTVSFENSLDFRYSFYDDNGISEVMSMGTVTLRLVFTESVIADSSYFRLLKC